MQLTYGVNDKPSIGKVIVFALQQLLAILAATIAVPAIVGNGMSQSAALFGAGVGTIVYLLFTKFKSPVFLGSSFAFLPSLAAAFGGAASTSVGYAGLLIGAVLAGLVYVVIAIVVKFAGVKWIAKLMPPVVIGPTVAIIGLSLAGNAISDSLAGAFDATASAYMMTPHVWVCLICALVTLFTVIACSVFGKKMAKLIPFILGILAGYAVALIFTLIGNASGNAELVILDFSKFANMKWVPDFTFIEAFKGFGAVTGEYIATVAVAYVPVAFVVFAEHIADHKNLSSIIGTELLEEPGLHRTLLGDGLATAIAGFLGGPSNTTYSENTGVLATTGNYNPAILRLAAVFAIIMGLIGKFGAFLQTIPVPVKGGVELMLFGMIASIGIRTIVEAKLDMTANRNLCVMAGTLCTGLGLVILGGIPLTFGSVTVNLSALFVATIVGVVLNLVLPGDKVEKK